MLNLVKSVYGLESCRALALSPATTLDLDATIVLAMCSGNFRKKWRSLLSFGIVLLLSSLVLLSPVFLAPPICPAPAPGPHALPQSAILMGERVRGCGPSVVDVFLVIPPGDSSNSVSPSAHRLVRHGWEPDEKGVPLPCCTSGTARATSVSPPVTKNFSLGAIVCGSFGLPCLVIPPDHPSNPVSPSAHRLVRYGWESDEKGVLLPCCTSGTARATSVSSLPVQSTYSRIDNGSLGLLLARLRSSPFAPVMVQNLFAFVSRVIGVVSQLSVRCLRPPPMNSASARGP
ncbi:hypothetical protein C8J57DRAFT_1655079 [Mycena rebaudengoi]|nr:hypothetical protein C8J57DRAFT_1655079 [Mycena rebaudengoi]